MRAFIPLFALVVLALAKPQYNYESGPIAVPQIQFNPVVNTPHHSTQQVSSQQFNSVPVSTQQFTSGSLGAQQFTSGSLGAQQFTSGSLGAQQFTSGSFGAQQLTSGSLGAQQFSSGSLGAQQFTSGSFGAQQLTSGSLGAQQFTSGSLGAQQFTSGSLGGAQQFTGGLIGSQQLNSGSVGAQQLTSGSFGTQQLTSGPVATQQFTSGPVATQQISSGPISTPHFTTPQVGGVHYEEPIQQVHQAPLISKQFYLHSAPEDHESVHRTKHLVLGRPQKNYRVIFIKNPSESNANVHLSAEYAPQEEKTVIYVLSQKDTALDIDNIATPAPTQPSKPEVFFIKYKTPEEAAHAQREIQNQYNVLGGSTSVEDRGLAPVTSVVGALNTPADNHALNTLGNEYLPAKKV